jgi:hypothetical protein
MLFLLLLSLSLACSVGCITIYTFRKRLLCELLNVLVPFLQKYGLNVTYKQTYGEIGEVLIEKMPTWWMITVKREFIDWKTHQVVRGAGDSETHRLSWLSPEDLDQTHRIFRADDRVPPTTE